MRDAQAVGNKLVLRSHIVLDSDVGKLATLARLARVGRAYGLAVANHGGDNDEVVCRVERFVIANEPLIVGDEAAEPAWVDDGWIGSVTECLVSDVGVGDGLAGFELEVAQVVGFVVCHWFFFFCSLYLKSSVFESVRNQQRAETRKKKGWASHLCSN